MKYKLLIDGKVEEDANQKSLESMIAMVQKGWITLEENVKIIEVEEE